jgi:hypothetical protein
MLHAIMSLCEVSSVLDKRLSRKDQPVGGGGTESALYAEDERFDVLKLLKAAWGCGSCSGLLRH